MAHKHTHCKHEKVEYCAECQVVHCLNCEKEWGKEAPPIEIWKLFYPPVPIVYPTQPIFVLPLQQPVQLPSIWCEQPPLSTKVTWTSSYPETTWVNVGPVTGSSS